ncbi:MAG TPA: hypothetical protein VGJ20_32235 [Xanthobacteraceae bacterium]|jgi:hypothetical protein
MIKQALALALAATAAEAQNSLQDPRSLSLTLTCNGVRATPDGNYGIQRIDGLIVSISNGTVNYVLNADPVKVPIIGLTNAEIQFSNIPDSHNQFPFINGTMDRLSGVMNVQYDGGAEHIYSLTLDCKAARPRF